MPNAAARSPLAWVPSLYFAQGLPYFAVALIAGLMFKSMGVANEDIAHWTAYIGAAWVFKPLWSPFLELAPSKKAVVVTFQLLGGACLGLVALALHLPVVLWLVVGVAYAGGRWHDGAAALIIASRARTRGRE